MVGRNPDFRSRLEWEAKNRFRFLHALPVVFTAFTSNPLIFLIMFDRDFLCFSYSGSCLNIGLYHIYCVRVMAVTGSRSEPEDGRRPSSGEYF